MSYLTTSFDRFRSLKSDERQSLSFRTRNKKCKTEEGVTINIGLMRQKGESADEVEIIRGKSLPLKISKKANAEEVLQEALKKRRMTGALEWIVPILWHILMGQKWSTYREQASPSLLSNTRKNSGKDSLESFSISLSVRRLNVVLI